MVYIMKILAIGDPSFVIGFKLAGAEVIICTDEKIVKKKLEHIINSEKIDYGMIILPERYVNMTKPLREKLIKENKTLPIFVFLPDYTGIKDKRIEEIKRLVISAIGAEIKL